MYTLLVTGDVPGASTYFNPLLQQTVIPCTSGTRPSSPHEGMTIYETDTDSYLGWVGASWVEWGRLNTADSTVTMGGGYTGTKNKVYRRGMWGDMCLTFNRPGASMASGVGVSVGNVPAGYRPDFGADFSGVTTTGIPVTCTLDVTGDLTVRPTALIAAATTIVLHHTYALA